MNILNKIKLSEQIEEELGLEKNWKDNISDDFIERVRNACERYKDVLKKLSKM